MKLCKFKPDDFSGGFAANADSNCMDDSYNPYSYNVEALGGVLKTMGGCSKYYTDEIINNERKYYASQLIVCYAEEDASSQAVVHDKLLVVGTTFSNRGLFLHTSDGWSKLQGNISEAGMGHINCFNNNSNTLLICNSSDGIYTYDPASGEVGYIDDAPGLSAMTLHYERIWGIGNVSNPNTVYYSAESDTSGWDPQNSDAGQITITTYDGDKFIGIANVFDDVVLYRKNSLFRIAGTSPANYQLKQIPASSGAVGPNAIANNSRYSFYIGKDGIYSYDGLKASIIENNRLRYFFEKRVNINRICDACAVIFNNKLYAAVPVDGAVYNNAVIEYDITDGVFNIRYGVDITSFAVFEDQLLFTDTDGYVCVFDNSTKYKETDISAHYETPYIDFDNKNIVRSLDSICFLAKGTGSLKISAETENGVRSKTVTLKSNDRFDIYKVGLYNIGRRYKFYFDNVSGSSFEIARPEFLLEQDDED